MSSSQRRPMTGQLSAVSSLPEYMISNFMPSLQPFVAQNPLAFRVLGLVLALWYFSPLSKLQAVWSQLQNFLVSSINVTSEEDLFDYLITYLSETKTLRADQSLNAHSNTPRERVRMGMRDPPEESNRRATAHNEPPKLKYEQTEGTQLFVFERRLFWAARKKGEGSTFTGRGVKNMEVLSISCLGRSTAPVKHLLQSIFDINKDKERASTIIRRPFNGGYGGRLAWSRITAKPRRALDTVILDQEQKSMVLDDIEEYMDEATSFFYGQHGIPYRRGYLFYGPPGVGKTSFALAIANKFNLDVYVLTLLDHNLTDSDLISLLNQLPGRSLLLLEDIDTAGLSSRKPRSTKLPKPSAGRPPVGYPGRGGKGLTQAAAFRRANQGDKKEDARVDSDDDELSSLSSKVSLSGLLNAIDGVAAPEGHILVMTTNKPELLDDALVRAGRISVRVKFDNASHAQAKEIFRRMYIDLYAATGVTAAATPLPPAPVMSASSMKSPIDSSKSSEGKPLSLEVEHLADGFADGLPEFEFSPADLQDYLLIHKKDPNAAIMGLEKWIIKAREQKKEREEEREIERLLREEKKRVAEEDWKDSIRDILNQDKEKEKKEKEDKEKEDKEKEDKEKEDKEKEDKEKEDKEGAKGSGRAMVKEDGRAEVKDAADDDGGDPGN